MKQPHFSKEVSEERIKLFGKIKNSEDDLSKLAFLNKKKADVLIKGVLGNLYAKGIAAYNLED
ncbi:hypothetical protein SAMN05216327_104263 [Dyadobacter sp. SG02]|uniref:hypothetical protein n=1 Tax=Dyadobacter sp. SG02 TaxID=1855291 RepID=UPI0008ADF580|nr:hypothetical protein [Dyadobacter sp. SG02]SEI86029.1 hypothetical protein SAMN05216327_104263 [Dyadobacter sp. SG02]